jgi:hypothetical protein
MANKIYFTVFLWLCCFFNANAQVWPKYYGLPNSKERAKDIIEAYDKGYLILGSYPQFSWLIKTDINGNVLWEKIFDNYPREAGTAQAIEVTSDGGILLCGMALSGFSNKNCPFVMKLNACGEKEWCKIFEGSPNAFPVAADIKETDNGDIVVLVNMYGMSPYETIHLFKLNANGEVLWKEAFATIYNYPNTNIKYAESLLLTSEGKYLISGRGYWEQPWNPGGPMPLTPIFIMADSNGYEEWVLPFALNDTIIGRAYSANEINGDNVIGLASFSGQTTIHPMFLQFDKVGNELALTHLSPASINPNLNTGHLSQMFEKDNIYHAQGTFGFLPSNQPIPVTLVNIDTALFNPTPIVYNYLIQTNTFWPQSLANTNDFKLLSSTNYRVSSTNYDIFLAKLNLNLEYDTAYTGNYTYDSLCFPLPPQSGFIYLNDCAIDMDLPGDSNCDAAVNVNDVVSSVARILGGNPQPFCPQNADVNGDGVLNVADVVGTVSIIISRRGRY